MSAAFKQLPVRLRIVLFYLLASPLFWLLDVALNWGMRVAFVEQDGYKALYYGLLCVFGIICYVRPGLTAIIALFESILNLVLHFVSFALPIFNLPAHVLQQQAAPPALAFENVLGFMLVGGILILSFHAALDGLLRRR